MDRAAFKTQGETMKPTEEQIREKLIEGWELTDHQCFGMPRYGYFDIKNRDLNAIVTGSDTAEINFWWKFKESKIGIKFDDFLSGNYDLSSISQHYTIEEWQRIIDMCKYIVRLITGEQDTVQTEPEQTLEEAVRDKTDWFKPYELTIEKSQVSFKVKSGEYKTTPTQIWQRSRDDGASWQCYTIAAYKEHGYGIRFRNTLAEVAALLTEGPEQTLEDDTTKPTYEELEQRVAELEKECKALKESNKANQKLLDYADTHLGEVDKLGQKIVDLEAQLQECISPADHEREMGEWQTAFEYEREKLAEQTRLATKYHQWFEEAHAERLKLKEAGR